MKRTTVGILKAAAPLVLLVSVAGVAITANAEEKPKPALSELERAQKVIGYVITAYELAQRVNGEPSEIERATAEIIDAVNAAKTELLDEIDEIAAAEVDACKDSALSDVENLARMTPAQLDNYAVRALDCVNKAVKFINTLDAPRAVNQVSFAMNTVAPLALIARARLGLTSDFLTANIHSANQATIRRLEPRCITWTDEESGHTLYWNVECTSFNGTKAGRTSVYGQITDYSAEITYVMRSTSYELSKTLLTM